MTAHNPSLFDLAPHHTAPPPEPQNATQRLRARQAARIAAGAHPLAVDGASIRLHPDTARPLENDGRASDPLRCGTCTHRRHLGGHAKNYPKCLHGYTETPIPADQQKPNGPKLRITMPRVTRGQASDCLAWWPACTAWEAAKPTPPAPPTERPASRIDDPWSNR